MKVRFALRISFLLIGITFMCMVVWILLGGLLTEKQTADTKAVPPYPSLTTDAFLRVQQLRKKNLRNFFLQHPELGILQTVQGAKNILSSMRVNRKLQMLYCKPRATGDDDWEEVLKQVDGRDDITIQSPVALEGPADTSTLSSLNVYNLTMLEIVFRSYTKVIFIRDPLERLVSSYLETSSGEITFSEFVEDVLSADSETSKESCPPITALCLPCFIRYDYIVKYDFFNDEVHHLMKRLGLKDGMLPTLKDDGNKWTHKWLTENLMGRLSSQSIKTLTKAYFTDLNAFSFKSNFLWNNSM